MSSSQNSKNAFHKSTFITIVLFTSLRAINNAKYAMKTGTTDALRCTDCSGYMHLSCVNANADVDRQARVYLTCKFPTITKNTTKKKRLCVQTHRHCWGSQKSFSTKRKSYCSNSCGKKCNLKKNWLVNLWTRIIPFSNKCSPMKERWRPG